MCARREDAWAKAQPIAHRIRAKARCFHQGNTTIANSGQLRPTRALFASQRCAGINAGSASRWDIAGEKSDTSQKSGNSDKRHDIGDSDTEEQRAHQAADYQRASDADTDSPQGQGHPAANDQRHDVRRCSAKRQPDAHFAAALANQIGDEPINSNHREPK